MLTAGPRASLGLLSPGDRPIERGDPFTVAFGIWGALNCRAGFVVEDAAELPAGIRDYVDRLVGPYFEAVAEWYAALHVGQTGRRAPGDHRPPPRRPVLRDLPQPGPPDPPRRVGELAGGPGLDDRAPLRDGPPGGHHPGDRAPPTSRPTSRTASPSRTRPSGRPSPTAYPDAWRRIQARRRFMGEALGIDLHPDVLPFSNLPAFLPPVPAPAGPGDDAGGASCSRTAGTWYFWPRIRYGTRRTSIGSCVPRA